MPLLIRIKIHLYIGVIFCVACTNTLGQEITDLTSLVNQQIDIRLKDGSLLAFAEVKTAEAGKVEGSIRNLKVQFPDSQRVKSIPVSRVIELYLNDLPLDVSYDRKQRCLYHDIEKKLDRNEYIREVEARLAPNRDRFWKPLTDEEHEKFMIIHREFIKKTKSTLNHIPFREVETKFFVFLTDLTPAEVDGYIVYLDAMYEQLCKAFGLSPQKNIWCGKCVVVAFREKNDYLAFERALMNTDGQGTQGLCHQYGDGKVIFAGFRGDNGYFGHVLVHETTHGFIHRYMTSARPPSWLHEGMADWLADAIVKGEQIRREQINSAITIIRNNGWGDFLTTDRIAGEHYGAASTMVQMLLERSKKGEFKNFFDGIKEGKPADQSLKENFGLSYQDLKIMYAQIAARLARSK
ncbi:MAG: hypothetical protein AAF623_16285 [Planctomycetota bacterium]